ncbi:hypothetical protein BCR37DRAFT_387015 [Protomyces lactucae-debilis]|uniref:Uncharacterized protein n=1 Tax=Protomyces lactucae-debilis TaxID=2754530 RepID=A0A1Y2FHR9_PROLT|nr:uncharacterized protein BCR37DRAFT_387015 [Protomyces lactucae-debilis]ORY83147.1 hypothetical protein BCR37DRAFT_387015 [Protomyces lactucae-debilis]
MSTAEGLLQALDQAKAELQTVKQAIVGLDKSVADLKFLCQGSSHGPSLTFQEPAVPEAAAPGSDVPANIAAILDQLEGLTVHEPTASKETTVTVDLKRKLEDSHPEAEQVSVEKDGTNETTTKPSRKRRHRGKGKGKTAGEPAPASPKSSFQLPAIATLSMQATPAEHNKVCSELLVKMKQLVCRAGSSLARDSLAKVIKVEQLDLAWPRSVANANRSAVSS